MKNSSNQFWELNLVCPKCKGEININNSIIFCENCNKSYSIINGAVPCFIKQLLSEHQKSELNYYLDRIKTIHSKKHFYNQIELCYGWVIKWINNQTIYYNTKIICIGGSYGDDLPHINSNFKFNVDHLAHKYIKMFPAIINSNVKYIASKSENLPFKDGYADIVYSRNSLDHVNNPIKTLLEIHRVLKQEGKFYLSVYYNSNFINSHESTSIDDEFIEKHLKNLFEVEFMELKFVEKSILVLPKAKKLGWLSAVLKKKKHYIPYNIEILENYETLLSYFNSAIYYDENRDLKKASKYYLKVIKLKPFLSSDKMRIFYSKIRYLALNDQQAFKRFFNQFKQENKDPFWWMIIIESSWSFMKKELKNSIKFFLPHKKQLFLKRYIKKFEFRFIFIRSIFQFICSSINVKLEVFSLMKQKINKIIRYGMQLYIKYLDKY